MEMVVFIFKESKISIYMNNIKFLKEYIIILIIIVFVLLIEIITGKITNNSLENINYYISNLENGINCNNDIEERMKELSDNWAQEEIRLSYYMEHNELERISSNITILRSNLRNISDNNYAEIRALIDEIKYRLEYIKNKQKLGLKNIF